jgi:hypothetical protein
MKCERCHKESAGYAVHDYCRTCSKNLCDDCMAKGCCGAVPAVSGMERDYDESPEVPMSDEEIRSIVDEVTRGTP